MKKSVYGAAFAAIALVTSSGAMAQRLGPTVVAVVDADRIGRECNACKAALATLQQQATAMQQRAQTLGQPLQTEREAIQKALEALGGKQPDAALQQRIQAYDTRQNNAQQELGTRQQQIQRNQAYVAQQLNEKLRPIYRQVMQNRGASVLLDQNATLEISPSIDVTNDVLALLNQQATSFNVNAPAAPAPARAQPKGR